VCFARPRPSERTKARSFIRREVATRPLKIQLLPHVVTFIAVGKFRRGGYVFITWKGDHPPRHVHVYRDGKLVVNGTWTIRNR
jgi:hypothetical protein